MPTEAAPIVVDPSGKFLGQDGAWSTFTVNVGSPPQALQVLPSTEQPASWVVAPGGCPSAEPANCTDLRGGAFDPTKSSSWFRKDVYLLNEAVNLGYGGTGNDINGTYGFDTLGVRGSSGAANISLDHQVVAGMINDAFYLGSLGLSPQQINFTTTSGDSSPSFLASLKSKGMIPSLAYGYTAGASYKQDGVNGSLVLGGYDTSRLGPDSVNFNFAPTPMRQLVVGLQSITYADSKGEKPLMSEGILALVDSTVPYLWLPRSACQVFETVFGISMDPIHNLYLVNESTHDTLMKTNPSVIFSLANAVTGGPSVNITLPYASFDLNASHPLVKSPSRYFPLQIAADDTAYTLGRTFLQEAYMIVDYENSTFSLSQSVHDAANPSHIVPIAANNTGTSPASPTATGLVKTTDNSSHGIGTGAIAGLAIAIAVVGILVAITAFICMRRRRRARKLSEAEAYAMSHGDASKVHDTQGRDSADSPEPKKPTMDVTVAEGPMTPLSEIDGNEYLSSRTQRTPFELPGALVPRSELSTPNPMFPPELPSPDPQAIRSELSTPEPLWPNSELPTPDPSKELGSQESKHELPSPSLSAADPHPSPALGGDRSALNSPIPRLPQQRPTSVRMDSSESESGFTYDGMPIFRHHRLHSDESNLSISARRPVPRRMDSDLSAESPILGHKDFFSSSSKMESPTVAERPAMRHSLPKSSRPGHSRLNSADSETWETRLQMSSSDESAPPSRFGTIVVKHTRDASDGAVETNPMLPRSADGGSEAKD